MPQLKESAFTFESKALPKDTFSVVRFSGEEGLSTLYRFEILLISENQEIDIAQVLQNPATFTIKGRFADGPDLPFHGILSVFEQMHQVGAFVYYRAELSPRLWWLTLTRHNQVFIDKKLDEYVGGVLTDGGLAQGLDFELRLQGRYEPRAYVCQYGESHFDFVSRWLEREGIYYWFEQGEQAEKMIASDTRIAHAPLPGHESYVYSPPSGLDDTATGAVIKRFTLNQTPMPKNVLLKDYNYMKPSLDLEGRAQVSDQGRGEIYMYGDHFATKTEGERLARVRAEQYLCGEKTYNGISAIPAIRPGYLFTLTRHYSRAFNQQYLTTTVRHEGSQAAYLVSGLGVGELEEKEGLFYRNTFTCIPGGTQFRPQSRTAKPGIAGTISAKIDAAGSGQYAELDEHGRYKVVMPFDRSGRKAGKASAWLRMMQPYAGQGMGFHAPLHKGTEVLLTFIEADPDRPVISGAIPNPETPSPVNDANQTQVRLVSGSGNVVHMEDQDGRQRMLMHSPAGNSFLRLGAPNDPDTGGDDDNTSEKDKEQDERLEEHDEELEKQEKELKEQDKRLEELETEWGARLYTKEWLKIQAGGENSLILGECIETIVGEDLGIKVINTNEVIGGIKTEWMFGGHGSYTPWGWALKGSEEKVIEEKLEVIEAKQEAIGEYDKVEGERGEVTWVMTSVKGEVSRMVGEANDVEGVVNRATAEVNRALGERIDAVGEQTQAIGTALRAVGTKLDAAGSKLESAGSSIQNSGVSVRSAGSRIQSAGSHVSNAAMIIRDAPIIMDQ